MSGVKRGLRRLRISQRAAARLIGKSQGLVSQVLSRDAISQPCLDALAAVIAERLR